MEDERAGAILWQGKWLIAVSLVFSIAVAVLATEVQTKVYEGSALVQVAGGRAARTDAEVIRDRGFLGKIRRGVEGGRYTADDLVRRIDAHALGGTALVRVTAEESSPALALALARDVATAFVRSTQGVTLAAPASATRSPIRPRTFQNVLAGVALGLLLGVILSWLRVRIDRALHAEEEVEELAGAEVLGAIPLRRRLVADDPVLEDAFDALFARLGGSPRAVTITSAGRREGRTSAAVGLAEAAVRAGVPVLLVDGEAPLEAGALAALRERDRLVVVDAPSLEAGPDASALVAASDAVLLVVRIGVTGRGDLAAAAAALRETGTPLLGVAVYRPQVRDDLTATQAAPSSSRDRMYDSLVRD